MVQEHKVTTTREEWQHPAGCCSGDCAPGAYPGSGRGDLVHEDLRVQGAASDPGALVQYGCRRWDTVDPDGNQTTHPAGFVIETTGAVELSLPEARTLLTEAMDRLSEAESCERLRESGNRP